MSLADNQAPNFSNNPVQPFDNREPSLALNYLIATSGIFPVQGGGQDSATPLLGQIIAFAGNFAPKGWALANGQLMPINQNQALFSILGTTYGGNGVTTFALPDLRDRAVIGSGNGFTVGALVGANFPTITADQLPTKNWTGAVSTDWNAAGNWSPSGVPASTDGVTIGLVGGLNPTLAQHDSQDNRHRWRCPADACRRRDGSYRD